MHSQKKKKKQLQKKEYLETTVSKVTQVFFFFSVQSFALAPVKCLECVCLLLSACHEM